MIAAEQFRRRLMSSITSDGGYAIYHADKAMIISTLGEYLRVAGVYFDIEKVRDIKVNGVSVDKNRIVAMSLDKDNIVEVSYRGLRSLYYAFGRTGVYADAGGTIGTGAGLRIIDVSRIDTSKVTTMEGMFSLSTVQEIIGLDKLDYSKVRNMANMFDNSLSGAIPTVDFGDADLSSVETMSRMFMDGEIVRLTMGGRINPQVDTTEMFAGVTSSGVFRYNADYDYSNIINALPSTWTAQAI